MAIISKQEAQNSVADDSRTNEIWEAWEDGAETERVTFEAPRAGTADIADLAARALGVDVSDKLNMRRCNA